MSESVSHLVGYRLELRAPRDQQSDPVTEPDVLTPRSASEHTDAFRLTTLADDSWGRGYLGIPGDRRGTLDLRTRKVDVGGIGVTLLDPRLADDDAVRWLTQFLGDANGDPQLAARLRAIFYRTLDAGCSWEPYFTGRTVTASKPSPPEYRLQCTDMASELQRDCFVGRPHSSITYAQFAPLLPYGRISAWADLPVTPGPGPALKATDGTLGRLRVQGSNYWDRFTLLQEELRARGTVYAVGAPTRMDGTDPTITLKYEGERVKVYVINPATEADGWFWLRKLTVQRNVEDHYVARQLYVEPLDSEAEGYATWASLGADGAQLYYYAVPGDGLTEASPLLIGPVHPVELMRDLVDGKFGYLAQDGAVRRQVPRDSTDSVWDDLIADESFGRVSFIVPEQARLDQWVREKLCVPFGLAYYFNAEGYFTPVDVRRPAAFLSLPELTDADLLAQPGAEDWTQDAGGAITRVGVAWREDTALDVVKTVVQSSESVPSVPGGLIRQSEQKVYDPPLTGDDPRLAAGQRYGDHTFEIDAEGLRGRQQLVPFLVPRSSALPAALAIAREAMQPYLAGSRTITLRCKRTPVPLGTTIGAPRLVTIPTLPDPTSNTYGETRLMRCISIQEQGVVLVLTFADLGLASVADPPEIGEPSNSTETGYVQADVTRNAAGDPVEIWVALTDTATAVRPADGDPAWIKATASWITGIYQFGPYPGGTRVWVKARSVPGLFGADGLSSNSLQQPSAFVYPSDFAAVNDYVDVTGLSGLSNLAATNLTAAGADLTWDGGDDAGTVQILIAVGAVTPGDSDAWATVSNFDRFFRVQGLEPATLYTAGVRLIDAAGGYGTMLTVAFTTAGGTLDLVRPAGIDFVYWSSIEGRVFVSSSYPLELERAPDSGGAPDLGDITDVAVSLDGVFYDPLPADQSTYWYRARHVPGSTSGSGVTASEWTDWLPAVARGTQGSGGGGGGNGDLPGDEQPGSNGGGSLVPILPSVSVARTDDGSTGTVTLTVVDPQGRVQRVEFQTQVGASPPSAWTEDTTVPYEASVAYTAAAQSVVRWRVIGFNVQGEAEQQLLAGEEHFGGAITGDPTFITETDETADLPNSRRLVDTATVEWDFATPGEAAASIPDGAVTTAKLADDPKTFVVEGHFYAAGDVVLWVKVPFACRVVGARAAFKSGASGSATFTVKSAPSVTGSFTDMIGGGTAPTISAAQASADITDTSGWTDRDLAAGEALELGCATLSGGSYVCLQLTLLRT
jgi:hypothetical protein